MSDDDSSGGCCGCIVWIVVGIVIFGLIFGVTVGGTHYGCSDCNCDQGIVLEANGPPPRGVPQREKAPEPPPAKVIIIDTANEEGVVMEDEVIDSKVPITDGPWE